MPEYRGQTGHAERRKHARKDAHEFNALHHHLRKLEFRIMSAIDTLEASVAAETEVIGSVITLLDQLSDLLKAAGTDPARLAALQATIDGNKQRIADAVVRDTPAA